MALYKCSRCGKVFFRPGNKLFFLSACADKYGRRLCWRMPNWKPRPVKGGKKGK